MEPNACLFDIGRFRNADGPGIRTILFFKGCPLRCQWCSNPFGLRAAPQLSVNRERCTGCARCVEACPHGVNQMVEGKVQVDFTACQSCGACVASCPVPCRSIVGTVYSVQELFREAYKDIAFYRKGGGGVTLSGGEALLQAETAIALLRRCRANYVNTCLETSAFTTWEVLEEVARYCNTIFVDIKHIDSARHKILTGVPNETILQNIQKLCDGAEAGKYRVIIRVPLIPGYTTEDENYIGIAHFVDALAGKPELNLLPYHPLGESKYAMIGEAYPLEPQSMLDKQDPLVQHAKQVFAQHAPNNPISIGGDAIKR